VHRHGYGTASGRQIVLFQDDAPGAAFCENIGEATTVGTYRVDGTIAALDSQPHRYYELVWTRHGHYYQVFTHKLSRAKNLAFARHLHTTA
jgi:hypothetical protein